MIDLKELREDSDRYRKGATDKGYDPAVIDELLAVDADLRAALAERESLTAEKNRIGKEIGALAGQLKSARGDQKQTLQGQVQSLQQRPAQIKQQEAALADRIGQLQPRRDDLWLTVPQPADADVPVGASEADNVQISEWSPDWFDPSRSFKQNKGFDPKTHIELGQDLQLFDIERGVKMSGTRSYVLTGDGMRLHQAILRYAFDYMTNENGFVPLSVPVLVRDQVMIGTGFFPHLRDDAYEITETQRGGGHDLYLTGTGECGLMGYHQDEIIDFEDLPLRYTTVSTCLRREAGSAGRDTAGLYRIHQFDKVEQVVICRADEAESRMWHKRMLGFVEALLQRLELPYRLLQCCTGDLGPKNADQIDIDCWMPGRGELSNDGRPSGAYGETHSASRIYGYQCRRLNIRYRDPATKKPAFCHALNNTVAASPRILIPLLELYQNADGSVSVPQVLQPYFDGRQTIGGGSAP